MFTTGGGIRSTAALADLNGNGLPEVIIGSDDDKVHVVDPTQLKSVSAASNRIRVDLKKSPSAQRPILWSEMLASTSSVVFDLGSAATRESSLQAIPTPKGDVYASPAVGFINQDEQLDIVVGSEDYSIYAFDMNGSLSGWPKKVNGMVRASVALGDFMGSGSNTILVGSYDYRFYAFAPDGTFLSGFPYTAGGTIISSAGLFKKAQGALGMDAFFGSSDGRIHGVNPLGATLAGWPTQASGSRPGVPTDVDASPALVDLTGNGLPEILVGSDNGFFYCFKYDGSLLWRREIGGELFSSPIVADIDEDGLFEVVFGSATGYLHTLNTEDGSDAFESGATWIGGGILSTPTWADVDGDGLGEIVIGCFVESTSGAVHGEVSVWKTDAPFLPENNPWPTFRQNNYRTGCVR